jgi:hypothetical protein
LSTQLLLGQYTDSSSTVGRACCSLLLLLLAWHSCEQYHACWQALHRFSLSILPHSSHSTGGSLRPLSIVVKALKLRHDRSNTLSGSELQEQKKHYYYCQ